jgi:hypothetical protein
MPPGTEETITLELILTAAGATVAASLIAAVIQIVKRLPGLGAWLDANREPAAALVLSIILVAYAYLATTAKPDAFNGFAAFLAWVGIAGLATAVHNATPQGIRDALSGH